VCVRLTASPPGGRRQCGGFQSAMSAIWRLPADALDRCALNVRIRECFSNMTGHASMLRCERLGGWVALKGGWV
jgi:hypothetical protein